MICINTCFIESAFNL